MEQASHPQLKQMLRVSAVFIALLGISLVVSIIANIPTLFLYVVIILEGTGLGLWILSRVQAENSVVPLIEKSRSEKYYYYEANRAESLFQQVKSVAKRSSGYSEHSKMEIARVLKQIIEESPSQNALMEREEFRMVLNPGGKDKNNSGKKEMVDKNVGVKKDYMSSLERLIAQLEGL